LELRKQSRQREETGDEIRRENGKRENASDDGRA
jgi:hypothetical protein